MSATLGPIHYRMFEKACSVDRLARTLAAFSDEQGWTSGFSQQLDATCPPLAGDIADHIDLSAIHASLSTLVNRSEDVLDAACAPLGEHLDELAGKARELGAAAARESSVAGLKLSDIWSTSDGYWLDGMPCDGMMQVRAGAADISWSYQVAAHRALGYEQIRRAWTEGFMEAAGVELTQDGPGSFSIRKAA